MPGKSPSLDQASLQARIIPFVGEWAPWTLSAMQPLPEGRVYVNFAHFLFLLPSQRNAIPPLPHPTAALTMPGYFPGLLLEVDSYIHKLNGHLFFHHECFLDWGCSTGWSCFCFSVLFYGLDNLGCFVYLFHCQSPQHPSLTCLTAPGNPPFSILIKLCHQLPELKLGQLCPPSFAKWHFKVFTYSPVLPSCLRALMLAE